MNREKTDPALDPALGTPKYYINTPGLQVGETYAWFPTSGNSMTDDTAKSIPSGSMVLGRQLNFKSVTDIPLHRPLVVVVKGESGGQHCVLKSGCGIQQVTSNDASTSEMLCLRSYNPRCDDVWIPFCSVKLIFVVERVRLPNGDEFAPKQEEVIRKRKHK